VRSGVVKERALGVVVLVVVPGLETFSVESFDLALLVEETAAAVTPIFFEAAETVRFFFLASG
jgi:hypothetical protein